MSETKTEVLALPGRWEQPESESRARRAASWVLSAAGRARELDRQSKIKLATAGAMGALCVTGEILESHGLVKGMPFPMQSLKHPWLGYWGAYIGGRIAKRFGPAAENAMAVGSAVGADAAAETFQNISNGQSATDWLQPPNRHGNADDFAAAMAGLALFELQTHGVPMALKPSYWRSRFGRPQEEVPDVAGAQEPA